MTLVVKSALVSHSAPKMFDLVVDIKRYPEFLPWCVESQIVSQKPNEMVAGLTINYRGLKQTFSTKNTFKKNQLLTMDLLKGPLKKLKGKWLFTPLNDTACKINFSLDFESDNFMLGKITTPIFTQIANTMLDSFIHRANEIYG